MKLLKVTIILLFICFSLIHAEEFLFVRQGKATCNIILPLKPSKFEKQAAEDLQSFLRQMSGANIKIYKEGTKTKLPSIFVGQTIFAQKKGIDFTKLGDEEYQIIPAERNLIITGGRPIGSFYGVWKILNRLGVWSLSMEQDIVPQKKDVMLNVNAERHKPDFVSRVIYDSLPIHYKAVKMPKEWFNRYGLYLLRNGINGRQHHVYNPLYVGKMSDIPHTPLHHTFCLYVPRHLFDKHPEYFAMDIKGKRRKPENNLARGGLCLANIDVAEYTAKARPIPPGLMK